jgi:hypothetical protein
MWARTGRFAEALAQAPGQVENALWLDRHCPIRPIRQERTMKAIARTFIIVLATLTLAAGSAQANGRHGGHRGGHHHGHHGHWGPGLFWGTVGLGVGLGISRHYYGPQWHPGYVVVEPPPYAYYESPPPMRPPVTMRAPDPVFYPRDGQSAAQTEADRQACNRWAITQRSAMADASVFHRATLACMEGRGYTVR